jgi:DNA-binding HxlR family transcriptional regulator
VQSTQPLSSETIAADAKSPKAINNSAKKALLTSFEAETAGLEGVSTHQLQQALQLVGDKYSLQIIQVLIAHKAQRFVELEATIEGISPRTLSARLKFLESKGLISRQAFATIPPKVEYKPTAHGVSLAGVIALLCNWASTLPKSLFEESTDND